jgi:hypothetical protein
VLPEYDLVFGKARCAIESLAVGCAVVVCDELGLGALVTTKSVEAMRQLNFGARTLRRPITAENVGAEIDAYDASDAAAVTGRMRVSADVDLLADQYAALYEELLSRPRGEGDELAAISRSLTRMASHLYAQVAVAREPKAGLLERIVRRVRKLIASHR